MNDFETCFTPLDSVKGLLPMSEKMYNLVLSKYKENTQNINAVFKALFDINEKLRELLAGGRRHIFSVIAFGYEAHIYKNELAEAMTLDACEFTANNFINAYFNPETFEVKEQYR